MVVMNGDGSDGVSDLERRRIIRAVILAAAIVVVGVMVSAAILLRGGSSSAPPLGHGQAPPTGGSVDAPPPGVPAPQASALDPLMASSGGCVAWQAARPRLSAVPLPTAGWSAASPADRAAVRAWAAAMRPIVADLAEAAGHPSPSSALVRRYVAVQELALDNAASQIGDPVRPRSGAEAQLGPRDAMEPLPPAYGGTGYSLGVAADIAAIALNDACLPQ